jgi:hypothetical protein
VDVSQRYDMLMARLGWPDESAPEAVCLLDLVTAVETRRESAMRRITIVEGTAAQLRVALGRCTRWMVPRWPGSRRRPIRLWARSWPRAACWRSSWSCLHVGPGSDIRRSLYAGIREPAAGAAGPDGTGMPVPDFKVS